MTLTDGLRQRPLVEKDCAGIFWRSHLTHAFVARFSTVQLSISELAATSLELPWAFRRQRGGWSAVALLRPVKAKQCPWLSTDGELALDRVPFLLRMYPFCLMPDNSSQVLAYWNDPECICSAGQPFFENGQLSGPLTKVAQAFGRYVSGVQTVHQMGADLHAAGVLRVAGDASSEASELFNVDETALQELSGETLKALMTTGALGSAHAQLLSQHHLTKFHRRTPKVLSAAAPAEPQAECNFLDALADDFMSGEDLRPGVLAP